MDQAFLILLTAHLVGDFVLQNDYMVERKDTNLLVLLLHVILVTAMTALFLGTLPWPILAVVFCSHFAMDYIKPRMTQRCWSKIGTFTIDQCVHLSVLILLAAFVPNAADDGFWMQSLNDTGKEWYMLGLTFTCGVIVAVSVGGHVIALITSSLIEQVKDEGDLQSTQKGELDGLENGGRYIGWLERALVMLIIMMGQPSGVGFLVAAKSILRFGDIKDGHQRRVAEYVIIGTFLSFGWAMLTAVLMVQTIEYWRE